MAGSSYPHIVFATNEETLPRAELESLLGELFAGAEPPPATTQGALEVVLNLGEYAFTFWYDDEAEGLGGRYAAFAPPMRQRRISKCTTMIDFSGDADPAGAYATTAQTIAAALAARAGVHVFSENDKTFVGLDYSDPFADQPPVMTTEPEPVLAEAGEPAFAELESVVEAALAEPPDVPAETAPPQEPLTPVPAHPGPVVPPSTPSPAEPMPAPEPGPLPVPPPEPEREPTPEPMPAHEPGLLPAPPERAPSGQEPVEGEPAPAAAAPRAPGQVPVSDAPPPSRQPQRPTAPRATPPFTVPESEPEPAQGTAPVPTPREPAASIGQVPAAGPAQPAPEPSRGSYEYTPEREGDGPDGEKRGFFKRVFGRKRHEGD